MLNIQQSSTSISNNNKQLSPDQLLIRINGTLPDIETLGSVEKSERAAEVKQHGINTNTSCSLFASANKQTNQVFHILVDVGQGIVNSIEKGVSELGFARSSSSSSLSSISIPDALLITHSHEDHIRELPLLADKATDNSKHLNVYCTSECRDQIIGKYPQMSSKIKNNQISFTILQPGRDLQVGPFIITPVLSYHGENSPAGSVIYIAKLVNRKVIVGWDFLSLPDVNENLLWNPDVAILGTQSYNSHPESGMISVSEAFELVRRWNAKDCYIVHYRGLLDFEEAANQWFRGPTKAMTTDELQKVIDSHLKVIGGGGKFRITVAREGTIWDSSKILEVEGAAKITRESKESSDQNVSTTAPAFIEIESLENYIFRMEKEPKGDKLKIMIEDRVNRFDLEFDRPRRVETTSGNGDDERYILVAQGVRGMLTTGPEFRMELAPSTENEYVISTRVSKGKKKNIFNDEIIISNTDAQRLKSYIKDNFAIRNVSAGAAAK